MIPTQEAVKMNRAELNEAIAKLQGWTWDGRGIDAKGTPIGRNSDGFLRVRPDYCGDIAAAWFLWDKLPDRPSHTVGFHARYEARIYGWVSEPKSYHRGVEYTSHRRDDVPLLMAAAWYEWHTGTRVELTD